MVENRDFSCNLPVFVLVVQKPVVGNNFCLGAFQIIRVVILESLSPILVKGMIVYPVGLEDLLLYYLEINKDATFQVYTHSIFTYGHHTSYIMYTLI